MRKGKRQITALIATAAILGIAAISFGAPVMGVKYGKHNFSKGAAGGTVIGDTIGNSFYSNSEVEICVFCHIPHNASGNKKLLWNRNNSTATFKFYTASPTINFNKNIAEIGDASMMCLSCHDGGTAINSVLNHNITMSSSGNKIGYIWDGPDGIMGAWGPNIGGAYDGTSDPPPGGDLTNDHPVSFLYSESRSAEPTQFRTEDGGPGGNFVGGLPLRSGKVECVTCHDPHINYWPTLGGDASYKPFLRKPNTSSSLCFTCHLK